MLYAAHRSHGFGGSPALTQRKRKTPVALGEATTSSAQLEVDDAITVGAGLDRTTGRVDRECPTPPERCGDGESGKELVSFAREEGYRLDEVVEVIESVG
jgi:hypothetical protein